GIAHANGRLTTLELGVVTVFVGGGFSNVAGVERNALGALDAVSGSALAWAAKLSMVGGSPSVDRLMRDGARLYLAGRFSQVGGQASSGFAAIDLATAAPIPGSPAVGDE